MLRRHYSNEATARLAVRGIEILAAWSEEVEVGESGYVLTGYLLMVAPENLAALRANVSALKSWGADMRVVTTDEIRELESPLRLGGIVGGAYEPDGGFADPQKISLSWFAASRVQGGEVSWARP
jgi:glycine/D-amino acid oxidase-like deaminating enzyme